jgi:hypothetical protein
MQLATAVLRPNDQSSIEEIDLGRIEDILWVHVREL